MAASNVELFLLREFIAIPQFSCICHTLVRCCRLYDQFLAYILRFICSICGDYGIKLHNTADLQPFDFFIYFVYNIY